MKSTRAVAGYLIFADNSHFKGKIAFYEGENLVSRNPQKADVYIPEHSISQKHAKITCREGRATIKDIGSKNGVYLNTLQKRLEKDVEVQIKEGTVFYLSELECRAQLMVKKEFSGAVQQQNSGKQGNKKQVKQLGLGKESQEEHESKSVSNVPASVNKNLFDKKFQKNSLPHGEKQERQVTFIQDSVQEISKKEMEKVSKHKPNAQIKQLNVISADQPKNNSTEKEVSRGKSGNKNQQQKLESAVVIAKGSKPMKNEKATEARILQDSRKKQKKEKQGQSSDMQDSDESTHTEDEVMTKKKDRSKRPSAKHGKRQPNLLTEIAQRSRSPYPRRTLETKRIMLSGCTLSFRPSNLFCVCTDIRADYDVLVMQSHYRTFKLLHSICKGISIAKMAWIIESESVKRIQNVERYFFPNNNNQIQKSIQKVRQGLKLFEGYCFVLVCSEEKYHMSTREIQLLVYSCGGELLRQYGRNKSKQKEHSQLIGIVPIEHTKQDAINARKTVNERVYTLELILDGCYKQEINWTANGA